MPKERSWTWKMKIQETMVPLIFTFKKSFIKPFGFKKKVYGSVNYSCYLKYLKKFFHEKNFDNKRTTTF